MPTGHSTPPLIHIGLAAADLRAALGPAGQPATFTFSHAGLTVTTPAGTARVTTRPIACHVPATHTAGLRPDDADILRGACDTVAGTVELRLDALRVRLTHPGSSVTVGRW